eukprot:bmy_08841T0
MTNQLPAVTSGSTVTFDIEAVTLGSSNNNEGGNIKLRIQGHPRLQNEKARVDQVECATMYAVIYTLLCVLHRSVEYALHIQG